MKIQGLFFALLAGRRGTRQIWSSRLDNTTRAISPHKRIGTQPGTSDPDPMVQLITNPHELPSLRSKIYGHNLPWPKCYARFNHRHPKHIQRRISIVSLPQKADDGTDPAAAEGSGEPISFRDKAPRAILRASTRITKQMRIVRVYYY